MNTELNNAAEKYAAQNEGNDVIQIRCFKAGAQWQAEQKQVPTDEEIEKLAEKEIKYPLKMEKAAFIKGFKARLQYAKLGACVWVRVNDMVAKLPEDVNMDMFEINMNGNYLLAIENGKVINAVNGWGNNCEDEFQNATVTFLYESALQYSAGDGWIDVKDRLPNNGVVVLLWNAAQLCQVTGFYCSTGFNYVQSHVSAYYPKAESQMDYAIIRDVFTDRITHWQPLPSPPINK